MLGAAYACAQCRCARLASPAAEPTIHVCGGARGASYTEEQLPGCLMFEQEAVDGIWDAKYKGGLVFFT